jgi:hypothetical protein
VKPEDLEAFIEGITEEDRDDAAALNEALADPVRIPMSRYGGSSGSSDLSPARYGRGAARFAGLATRHPSPCRGPYSGLGGESPSAVC